MGRGRNKKHYAFYRGDTFLLIGTVDEIAKYLNVSYHTAAAYVTPSWRKFCKNQDNCYTAVEVK